MTSVSQEYADIARRLKEIEAEKLRRLGAGQAAGDGQPGTSGIPVPSDGEFPWEDHIISPDEGLFWE